MMKKILTLVFAALLFSGCSNDDSYSTYSRYKASFSYFYVMTTTPLKDALNSPGIFCTVMLTPQKKLVFTSLTQTQSIDVTASAAYQSYVCLSGFIVGKANLPEIGMDGLSQVCFDLACSNCFHDDAIKPNLSLRENGRAYCSRCKRTYNLNNMGLVETGEKGRPLERYHILYDNANRMMITN